MVQNTKCKNAFELEQIDACLLTGIIMTVSPFHWKMENAQCYGQFGELS